MHQICYASNISNILFERRALNYNLKARALRSLWQRLLNGAALVLPLLLPCAVHQLNSIHIQLLKANMANYASNIFHSRNDQNQLKIKPVVMSS